MRLPVFYRLTTVLFPEPPVSLKKAFVDLLHLSNASGNLTYRRRDQIGPEQAAIAARAWAGNKDKHNEICDTLQPGAWGYTKDDDGKHRTSDEVLQMLADAEAQNCNLLLNTGPLPDGSIHPEDVKTLRAVGRRMQST